MVSTHVLKEHEWRCIWSHYCWEDFFISALELLISARVLSFYTQAREMASQEEELRDSKESFVVSEYHGALSSVKKQKQYKMEGQGAS